MTVMPTMEWGLALEEEEDGDNDHDPGDSFVEDNDVSEKHRNRERFCFVSNDVESSLEAGMQNCSDNGAGENYTDEEGVNHSFHKMWPGVKANIQSKSWKYFSPFHLDIGYLP